MNSAQAAGDGFEDPEPRREATGDWTLDLDGFEGPIDVLLSLARDQKVDLTQISILQLAEQYLAFIAEARALRLEIAADYLVMAAWLAFLKSRLLLPEQPGDDEPTGEELAAILAFQLQRLEAMRAAAGKLMALPQLGRDRFPRGAPEGVRTIETPVYDLTLYQLLKAYADQKRREMGSTFRIEPTRLWTVDEALVRLRRLVGHVPDWTLLQDFLPAEATRGVTQRSAIATTFVASLELAKQGQLTLRQDRTYGPIWLKAAMPADRRPDGDDGGQR